MTASGGDETAPYQPGPPYSPYPQYQGYQGGPPPQGYLAPPGYQQTYPQAPYQQPHRATDGLAIASMVLGIVWVFWIGSILAVIFGHVALNRIRRDGKSGRGMAIAGLVLGYIGVGFLALIILLNVIVAASRGS